MESGDLSLKDRVQNALARAILGAALFLPYRMRVATVGLLNAYVVAPLAGWNRRIDNNLIYALPELDARARRKIARRVADNMGRSLIEIYSGAEFIARTKASTIDGPGLEALKAARAAARPIVLVTAHLGNYDAVRGKLSREGYPMAALYRPMKNTAFNAHYIKAISTIAQPVYPTDARGITSLVKHLKNGGVIGIVADVASTKAPLLKYFGKPAHTPLSAGEWALKYDAEIIPIFGIRDPDGFRFRIHVGAPLTGESAEEMMQAYNDAVEKIARAHPDQWFWIHRRWKLAPWAKDLLSEGEQPPE